MKKWLLISSIMLASGCAHFNSEFDCPASKGVGCKRLSAINEDYNAKKEIQEPTRKNISEKRNQLDVYLQAHEDSGTYHHPRKVTIKV